MESLILRMKSRQKDGLRRYPIYGKNEITLNRHMGYHEEIQGLMAR